MEKTVSARERYSLKGFCLVLLAGLLVSFQPVMAGEPAPPAGMCTVNAAAWPFSFSADFSGESGYRLNYPGTGWTYDSSRIPQRNATPAPVRQLVLGPNDKPAELYDNPVSSGTGETWVLVSRLEAVAGSSESITFEDKGLEDHDVFAVLDSAGNILGRYPASGSDNVNNDAGSGGAVTISFTMPADGVAYAYTWVADFGVSWGAHVNNTCRTDYSDAPSGYGTATHTVKKGLIQLGSTLTADGSAVVSADDASDDSVVTAPPLFRNTVSYTVELAVTNITGGAATLHGWIDFDRNGTFDTDEHASIPVANGDTTASLSWQGLTGLGVGSTFARLRLTTDTLTAADVATAASDGEVEDYTITIIDQDLDGDGLTNAQEALLGTDPEDADTDNDGISDGIEDANQNGVVDAGETSPLDADSDDDGLSDGAEDANHNGTVDTGETDPLNADTDADGLQDGTELGMTAAITGGSSTGTNPVSYTGTDTGTFIPDADDSTTTDPLDPDTDGGGVCDGSLAVSGTCEAGEDANNNGAIDAGETNPNLDSDDPQSPLKLQVRAWLQGAYNTTGMMRDDLRIKGLLPLQQPYGSTAYAHAGTETTNSTVLAVTGADAAVDWMLVELWDAAGTTQLARQAVLIQRDGDLMDSSAGSTELQFPGLAAGSYQVLVRHRNHLDIRTLNAVALNTATATLVDLGLPATATLGDYSRLEVGTLALMWAGDINASQSIIGSGPGLDSNVMLGQVLSAEANTQHNSNYILNGYYSGDLNLDGRNIFAGPGNDSNLLLGNILSHPLNVANAANYIISGGLRWQ
ncbi:MAG TPA: GEVED domain-containing protein [Thiolinea sp.]|nr:GEVED domain-containing protein [Thiolinea sp.]